MNVIHGFCDFALELSILRALDKETDELVDRLL